MGENKFNQMHISASADELRIDGVGIFNLRVLVKEEDGLWVAQGLEIDYAAQGTSLAEAKQNFQAGFLGTITEHLTEFGKIDQLLVPAAEDVFLEHDSLAGKGCLVYQHVSLHIEPMRKPASIIYLSERTEKSAA
ncbi:MAG TPA: hypothetical protein VLV78_03340 [Thermoanaerobaculia bacterium]|nr:hypothetical protein [Thermoanaerobaculia bacterium]